MTRLRYVHKLAEIFERQLHEYQIRKYFPERGGTRHGDEDDAELYESIDRELNAHPTPENADPKKLTRLLLGKWQFPRHMYVFNANGTTGMEDGEMDSRWRIRGNQILHGNLAETIILLDSDYLILSIDGQIAFHSRVKH
jgi:hypothetical protein